MVDHSELAEGRIRVRVSGAGRPLVLLHSLLADASSWEPLAERLSRTAQVIVFDLPGFAGLPPLRGGITPAAHIIGGAIEELDLAAPPVVIGNGFGSFLALRLALDASQHVGALVLIGCGARFSDSGRGAFRAMRHAAAVGGLEAVADTAMARLFAAAFRAANRDLVAARRAAFLRTDPATFADACEALETLDLSSDAHWLGMPALLIAGSEDQATPPAMAEALARLMPQARFKLLEGLAHVPQLQDPDQLAAITTTFVDTLKT